MNGTSNSTYCLYMDSPVYMKNSYRTRNSCTKHQDKGKKRLAYSPYSALALCKSVGGAKQRTLEHFRFDYSLAQRAATLQIRLNYTTSNDVNARHRNSRVHACQLRKKKLLCFVRAKKLTVLYSCFCFSI